jgi:hypothetical protein
VKAEDLGYVEALLGHWEVRYPGADGMIVEDYAERLELKVDGTFSWEPTPLWAKPEGRWGITVDDETEKMRLYVEERNAHGYRGNWLVVVTLRFGAHTELTFHWQRTFADAVVFADRVLVARQVAKRTEETLS